MDSLDVTTGFLLLVFAALALCVIERLAGHAIPSGHGDYPPRQITNPPLATPVRHRAQGAVPAAYPTYPPRPPYPPDHPHRLERWVADATPAPLAYPPADADQLTQPLPTVQAERPTTFRHLAVYHVSQAHLDSLGKN